MCIILIDTSVLLNLLNIAGRNQESEKVTEDFRSYVALNCTFILPMASIIETGNHIAQNGDGRVRREAAERFIKAVKGAFEGTAPWSPAEFPSMKEISSWLNEFPEVAGKNKRSDKLEGASFGDLSIIKEFEKACRRFPMSEVFVWSLDADLQHFRQQAHHG